MAEITLDDINRRIREEGDLDRNKGSNSIKSLKEAITALSIGFKKELSREGQLTRNKGVNSFKSIKEALIGNDLERAEKEREQRNLLQSIADGIARGNDLAEDVAEDKPEEEKGFFSKLINSLGAVILGGGGIAGILSRIPLVNKLIPIFAKIGTIFSKLGPFFNKTILPIFKVFSKVLSKLALPLTAALAAFRGIVEGIKGYKEGGILGAIEGFFIGVFDSIIGDIALLVGNIGEKFLSLFGLDEFGAKFRRSIEGIIESFKGIFSGAFDAIRALFSGDTEAFKEAIGSIFESVKSLFGNIIDNVLNSLELVYVEIPKRIFGFITDSVYPKLEDFVTNDLVPLIKDFFINTLWENIKKGFLNVLDIGGNVFSVLKDLFAEFIVPPAKRIFESISKLIGAIIPALIAAGKALTPGGESPSEAFTRVFEEKFGVERSTGPELESQAATASEIRAAQQQFLFTSPSGFGGAAPVTQTSVTNTTYQNSAHLDESSVLTRPAHGF